ncbi:hypothetical protein HB364_08355 [Pseudoflavitalea sp. X16]|uniref:hypothetical protein n=1 Tax=Paraflavitalea devenefica TaxID=2716334 RepID=UPI0014246F0F|nr:hypothetical protein [Paraflavitalea devenefica]NII25087.1 hypothetical protein [Paraflavitalea devenefica]
MKQLLFFLLVLRGMTGTAQNVGIGITSPVCKLDVWSPESFVSRFSGPDGMYVIFTENGLYRGYIGSFSGNAEDVDFGTGAGNTTGKVHLTIQASPKLTVETDGNINIQEELNRSSKTGTANLLPICYGNISSAGTIYTGSGNFTVSRIITGWYAITITGENYQFQQYVTVVTPSGSTTPVITSLGSGSGNLHVHIFNLAGAEVDNQFSFVVYKQ